MRVLAVVILTILMTIGLPIEAEAQGDHDITSDTSNVTVKAWKSKSKSGDKPRSNRQSSSRASKAASKLSKYDRELAAYNARAAAYRQYLVVRAGPNRCSAAGCPQAPTPVPPPGERPVEGPQTSGTQVAVPQISPEQAAYVAVARLRLTAPEPVIGPSPEINEWKIAAVGYPYWLWAEGDLDPAPVSTTVEDLTVRLDARLQSTTFDLGDGSELTCTDLTRKWSRAVEPGAASPACGHTYTTPSLPGGKYTITAYSTWAVDWSVNGVGGTIPLYQQASTTLPVGELQVLTH